MNSNITEEPKAFSDVFEKDPRLIHTLVKPDSIWVIN